MESNNISTDQTTKQNPSRTSLLAITSLALGIIGILIPIVTALPGLVLGIVGWRRIAKSSGRLGGKKIAIAGVIVSFSTMLLGMIVLLLVFLYAIFRIVSIPDINTTGGYTVLCEAQTDQELDKAAIEETCTVLKKRLDPGSRRGITVRQKEKRLFEIGVPVSSSLPRFSRPDELESLVTGLGILEFRMIPFVSAETENLFDSYTEALKTTGPESSTDASYVWMEVRDPDTWNGGGITGTYDGRLYLLCSNRPDEIMLQGGPEQWKLKRAYPTMDEQGRHAIGFLLNQYAADQFYKLTTNNIGESLCILLDGRAVCAPRVNSAIRSSGLITGTFTQTEVEDMINMLNAGMLSVQLHLLHNSTEYIQPSVSSDEDLFDVFD